MSDNEDAENTKRKFSESVKVPHVKGPTFTSATAHGAIVTPTQRGMFITFYEDTLDVISESGRLVNEQAGGYAVELRDDDIETIREDKIRLFIPHDCVAPIANLLLEKANLETGEENE